MTPRNGEARIAVTIDQAKFQRMISAGGTVYTHTRIKAEKVAAKAREIAPVDTGQLKNSISVDQSRSDIGRFQTGFDVVAKAPHATFVTKGTRPHIITPKRAKVLRFQSGGSIVFTKKVNHPGTKANNFLLRALTEVFNRL